MGEDTDTDVNENGAVDEGSELDPRTAATLLEQTKIDGRPIGWQVEFITCTVGDTTYSGCSRSRPFASWRAKFRAVRVAGCWTRSIRIGVRSWARALAAEIIPGLRWG